MALEPGHTLPKQTLILYSHFYHFLERGARKHGDSSDCLFWCVYPAGPVFEGLQRSGKTSF